MVSRRWATTALALIPFAVLGAGPLWAQAGSAAPDDRQGSGPGSQADRRELEEITVRGRRSRAAYRDALDTARVRVYDLFNEINSDDAFDVRCQYESTTGSRFRQHVCRPRFKTDISNSAAREWRAALISACPSGVTQECIFSEAAQNAMSSAQSEESRDAYMQRRFTREMERLVLESPELRQAMLDYEALQREYREARERGQSRSRSRR